MSRPLRHVPREKCLFEVTVRTVQARFLLRPSVALNEIILGVLGRAQRLHEVKLMSFCFLSGHFHLLVLVNDAKQLSTALRSTVPAAEERSTSGTASRRLRR